MTESQKLIEEARALLWRAMKAAEKERDEGMRQRTGSRPEKWTQASRELYQGGVRRVIHSEKAWRCCNDALEA